MSKDFEQLKSKARENKVIRDFLEGKDENNVVRLLDVDFYREWINVEIDGIEKCFDLHSTLESGKFAFYLDDDYTECYIFDENNRKIMRGEN